MGAKGPADDDNKSEGAENQENDLKAAAPNEIS
jgi:hypothetical protein